MTPADALEAEMLGDYEGAADVWRALAAEKIVFALDWGLPFSAHARTLQGLATVYQWPAERCDACAVVLTEEGIARAIVVIL